MILVFGTPTISAAVRCNLSLGGMKLAVCELVYLFFAFKSCPLTKLLLVTSRVVLPKVFPYRFSGLIAGT